MATARVSFATSLSTEPESSSPASSTMDLADEIPESATVKAILGNIGDLLVIPERLQSVEKPADMGDNSDVFLAKLDETSTPTLVVMKRLQISWSRNYHLQIILELSEQIKVLRGLNHPNVLEVLGCSIHPKQRIIQILSPYLINGNIRQYLARAPAAVAERLGFVRDVTAGLDYLHSQSPPIYYGRLTPFDILIDNNLNAVLSDFGFDVYYFADLFNSPTPRNMTSSTRYRSPETVLDLEKPSNLARDIWAWGCCAFEILTGKPPFHQHESHSRVLFAIINREAPGEPDLLLDLVPEAPKPEYAATLRLLYSYLPFCWEYEPRKRPPISLLHTQAFIFSFEDEAGDSVVATLKDLAHLLIPPDRLRIVEHSELGAGNYGEVVLGILDEASPTPRDVAVKRLKAVGTRGERVRLAKRLARELNIWAKIKHPNVVELIGYYLDEKYESPLLISALAVNGNVLNYIERFKPDIGQRMLFVKGITAGLACLHNFDPAICHADLKPANVLIDLQMNAVLCDFGLASFVSSSDASPGLVTSTTLKGTPRYMSPELLLDMECSHNLDSDVWAWACTVFQVLTGSIPYAEVLGEVQFYMAIWEKKLPGDIDLLDPSNRDEIDSESALALQFLSSSLPQCWDFDPQNRPSISSLLSHLSSLSAQTKAVGNGIASDASGGLENPTVLAGILENPLEECTDSRRSQKDEQNVRTDAVLRRRKAAKTRMEVIQDEEAIKHVAHIKERAKERTTTDSKAPEMPSDHSSLSFSAQRLSILTLIAVCILSLCANVYFLFRK